jgi:tetratricopeptide (TPR) repeat protein
LFAGQFSFEFASIVWGGEDNPGFEDEFDQLVQSSLLTYHQSAASYSIAPPLRLYLRGTLESGEIQKDYCNRIFDAVIGTTEVFESKGEAEADKLLDHYYADVEQAIRASFDIPEIHPRLPELFPTLPYYWLRRSRLSDIDALLIEATERVDFKPLDRAAFLNVIGAARMYQREYGDAEEFFLQVLRLYESEGEARGLHRVLSNLASTYLYRLDLDRSAEFNARAVEAARAFGDPQALLGVLLNYADCLEFWLHSVKDVSDRAGKLVQIRSLVEEAATLVATVRRASFKQHFFNVRGDLCLLEGNLDEAESDFSNAALICEQAGLNQEASQAMDRLCWISIARGAYERAAKLTGGAIALRVDNSRVRRDFEEAQFKEMVDLLREKLGSTRFKDFMEYGASCTISDLCVLTEVP